MANARAAEVYLVEQWPHHTGEPRARRNKIFADFIKLGLRGRWKYHQLAENVEFSDEERKILLCRTWKERAIAEWVGADFYRILFTNGELEIKGQELELCTGWAGDDDEFVCNDIDALPERVYSMTAFDHPDDVEEAKKEHDQSLWVSGVYWTAGEELKIVWVDEYGEPIREKVCEVSSLQASAEVLDEYKPFESSWWTEATKVGKYANEEWWM